MIIVFKPVVKAYKELAIIKVWDEQIMLSYYPRIAFGG